MEFFQKNLITILILVGIILISFIVYSLVSNSSNKVISNNSTTNIEVLRDTPGPTQTECISTIDCKSVCGNNDCLIGSCTYNPGEKVGYCSCLGICNY